MHLIVTRITGSQLPLIPEIALLNYWALPNIPKVTRELFSLLYAAARLVIAQHWKSALPLQLSHWRTKVVDLLIMSKITDQLHLSYRDEDGYTFFDILWFPVLSQVLANPAFGGVSPSIKVLLL